MLRCKKLRKMFKPYAKSPSNISVDAHIKIIEHIRRCEICKRDVWVQNLYGNKKQSKIISQETRQKIIDHFLDKALPTSRFQEID